MVSAKVMLAPPGKTVEIEDIPKLVDYLNDVGYKTKYEPWEALSNYANELLNSGIANTKNNLME